MKFPIEIAGLIEDLDKRHIGEGRCIECLGCKISYVTLKECLACDGTGKYIALAPKPLQPKTPEPLDFWDLIYGVAGK